MEERKLLLTSVVAAGNKLYESESLLLKLQLSACGLVSTKNKMYSEKLAPSMC